MKFLLTSLFLLFSLENFSAQIIYVDLNSSGQNTGESWSDSYTDLHTALAVADAGDSIWIAAGTYYPTNDSDRSIRFEIPEGISVFGGFAGTETDIAQRDLEQNQTILSGNIGNSQAEADNSYTIASLLISQGGSSVLDGLSFEEGMAVPGENGSANCDNPFECRGGGLYIYNESEEEVAELEIRNCQFLRNKAAIGGGLYLNAENGLLDINIEDCDFIENDAEEFLPFVLEIIDGGGAYITQRRDSGYVQSFNLSGSNFIENSAHVGGGMYYDGLRGDESVFASFQVNDCLFERNVGDTSEGGVGAAIYLRTSSDVDNPSFIRNSRFSQNAVYSLNQSANGGAVSGSVGGDGLLLSDCVFDGNYALYGGAVHSSGTLTCHNVEFIENTAFEGGGIRHIGDLFIHNCIFANNYAQTDGGAVHNFTWNAEYSNSVFYNNRSVDGSGALLAASVTTNLNNCIFWGNISENTIYDTMLVPGSGATVNNCIFDKADCQTAIPQPEIEFTECNNSYFNEYPDFRDTAALDFSLSACSFAVNAGAPIPDIFSDIETDIAGNPRVLDGIPDIGAYEMPGIQSFATLIDATGPLNSDGSIEIDSVTGGVPPYEITWDNGVSGTVNAGLPPGTFEVTITDSLGCSYTTGYELSFTSGMADINTRDYRVFPNPLQNTTLISWEEAVQEEWSYQLRDARGVLCLSERSLSAQTQRLDMSALPAGAYFLLIEQGTYRGRRLLLKR